MLAKSTIGATNRKKTIVRSFRISEEAFNALEKNALAHKASLNTLVDQIFEARTSYERFVEKFGLMRVSKVNFLRILELGPAEGIAQAARLSAKNQGKVGIVTKYGELNLTNLLHALSLMMTYGGW